MTSWKYLKSIPKKQLRRLGYLIKYFFRNKSDYNAILALGEQRTKIIGIHEGPSYSDEIGFWLNVTNNILQRVFQNNSKERGNQIKQILYRNYSYWSDMSFEQQKYEENLIETDIYALLGSYIKEIEKFGLETNQNEKPHQKSYSYIRIFGTSFTVLVGFLTILYTGYDYGKNEDLKNEIESLEQQLNLQKNLNDEQKNYTELLLDSIKTLNDTINK